MKKDFYKMIWTNNYIDYEDYRADYPDDDDIELQNHVSEINYDELEFIKHELDIKLSNNIIIIADLGLWDGHHTGYKEIGSYISDCFNCDQDYNTWYIDKCGDLRCEAVHHDGTNNYLYRVWKPDISEKRKNTFRDEIYRNDFTDRDIKMYTNRIGGRIGEVYGWHFVGRKAKKL